MSEDFNTNEWRRDNIFEINEDPQSPVTWLVNNLDKYVMWDKDAKDLVNKALQMEKNNK